VFPSVHPHLASVTPGDPGARGGLKDGDVIVAVDGKPIETPREFQRALAELPIGRVMTLVILREGAKREIKVQVEQQQARQRAVAE
jgi:serine protease Do